jgi:hypothetical protein
MTIMWVVVSKNNYFKEDNLMRAIIIGLTFLLISAVYMLEVSMSQAHILTIYEITYIDENQQVVHKDYFAAGADLTSYECPVGPTREGFVFVGWNFVVPNEMPNANIIVSGQYVRSVVLINQSI